MWKFEKTVNLGHILVFGGLIANMAVLAVNYGKSAAQTATIIAEHERRIMALEGAMAKLTDVQYELKQNIAVLTEIVRRMEPAPPKRSVQ